MLTAAVGTHARECQLEWAIASYRKRLEEMTRERDDLLRQLAERAA